MTVSPTKMATWFGPEDRSLFGVLEFPSDREIRAGVIVVPSLGIEQVTTYRGARRLTEQLVRARFVTLRYDHPGTGSSTGDQLSDTAWDEWREGVLEAVAMVQAQGVNDVTLVAIRAGCVVADAALGSVHGLDARLVHWDPPRSGRRWLREQTTKFRLSVGDVGCDPGVSVLGGHFSRAAAERLKSATWSAGDSVSLVAGRPDVLSSPDFGSIGGGRAETVSLVGAELFAAPPAFVHHVPESDIGAIVSHLADRAGDTTLTLHPLIRRRAVVGVLPDGSPIVEEIESVRGSSDLQLFSTRVEVESALGAVVFQSTALEPAWGPTRAWVDSARENAGGGLVCFRFDKAGGGEAGTVDGGEIAVLYSHESRRDAHEVFLALADRGLPSSATLSVGLCSGAWMAAESAIRARAGTVLLFGMIQWSRVREPVTREFLSALGYDAENVSPAATKSARTRLKPLLRRLLPYSAWEALGRRGITQVPGPLLGELWRAGVRTTVALTPQDDDHFVAQRGDAGLRRLRRRGYRGRIERIPSPQGDHDLYRPDTREAARRLIREEADALRSRLGLPTVRGEHRPLRALFVNENIGGHATVHLALRRAFADRDDIAAEFLDAEGPGIVGKVLRAPVPGLARADLDLQPLRGQLVHSWAINKRVRQRLNRGDIDAIHLYTQNAMLGGTRIVRRVPTVITTDSVGLRNAFSIPYRSPTRFTRKASRAALPFERPVLDAAHHVLANALPVVESLTSPDYGLSPDSVSLLRMGIWSPFLTKELPKRPPDRRPTVVFLGTSMDRKGGTLLLEAWRSCLRDRADLLLITLDAVAEEPGLRVVRDLRPGDDRLWELLAGSDIMCFPSIIDQAPNAVLEAAVAGLPVIAHPAGAIPEMVIDGVTGLLVDGSDPRAVVGALDTLISDPGMRRRMGEAGCAHVREHYNIVRSADTIVCALHRAVDAFPEECEP